MWKRMLVSMVSEIVKAALLEAVMKLKNAEEQMKAIVILKELRGYLATSSSSTTRAIANLLPFEVN